jgi:hypothetical protein
MTDRELMQQALDALINAKGYIFHNVLDDKGNRYDTAIEALRARLAQPEPEPVACDCDSPAWCKQYKKCHRAMLGFEPYVAPPQREWKGLTDEEIRYAPRGGTFFDFARAIEAKLKEKNI